MKTLDSRSKIVYDIVQQQIMQIWTSKDHNNLLPTSGATGNYGHVLHKHSQLDSLANSSVRTSAVAIKWAIIYFT